MTPMQDFHFCQCGKRPERHFEFFSFGDWMIFTAVNKMHGARHLREKIATPGESGLVRWEALQLWLYVLEMLWHRGSVPDNSGTMRKAMMLRKHTGYVDFGFAWERVRRALEPYPGKKKALWLPRLEEVRARECEGRAGGRLE